MLKIKNEFKGTVITRKHMALGNFTFDTRKEYTQLELENYSKLGFSDIFEDTIIMFNDNPGDLSGDLPIDTPNELESIDDTTGIQNKKKKK